MTFTWYVTYELPKTLKIHGRRSPRATQNFQTETEAKDFARMKFAEGLIVNAGTINPFSPRQAIAWGSMPGWFEEARERHQQLFSPGGDLILRQDLIDRNKPNNLRSDWPRPIGLPGPSH